MKVPHAFLACPDHLEFVDPVLLLGQDGVQASADELGAIIAALIADPTDDLDWWETLGAWAGAAPAIFNSAVDRDPLGRFQGLSEPHIAEMVLSPGRTTYTTSLIAGLDGRAPMDLTDHRIRRRLRSDLEWLIAVARRRNPELHDEVSDVDLPPDGYYITMPPEELQTALEFNDQLHAALIDRDGALFTDITSDAMLLLDSVRNLRICFVEAERALPAGTITVQVDPDAGWDVKAPDEARRRLLRRGLIGAGLRTADFAIPPRSGIHYPPASLGDCQPRLIANLDRNEFIDPAALGDHPSLPGLMQGENRTALALAAAVTYPRRRSPTDWPDDARPADKRLVGRWRGDRLVATAERPGSRSDFPANHDVLREMTDISEVCRTQIPTLLGLAEAS